MKIFCQLTFSQKKNLNDNYNWTINDMENLKPVKNYVCHDDFKNVKYGGV